jgi:hypothetical protein
MGSEGLYPIQPHFLTFRTSDGPDSTEWSATGLALLGALADGLRCRGFDIDLEAGSWDPDWYFVARRDSDLFALVLVIGNFRPCRWSIGLEDGQYHNLNSEHLRAEVNPVLERVVSLWPGVSAVRWRADATTIGDA